GRRTGRWRRGGISRQEDPMRKNLDSASRTLSALIFGSAAFGATVAAAARAGLPPLLEVFAPMNPERPVSAQLVLPLAEFARTPTGTVLALGLTAIFALLLASVAVSLNRRADATARVRGLSRLLAVTLALVAVETVLVAATVVCFLDFL